MAESDEKLRAEGWAKEEKIDAGLREQRARRADTTKAIAA